MGIVVVKQWALFAYNNGHRLFLRMLMAKLLLCFFLSGTYLSEQRELHGCGCSFGLMLGNEDALRHEVVVFLSQGATMGKLFYAVEAVFGYLIRGYEYGLRLPLTPLIESFIVETSFAFF